MGWLADFIVSLFERLTSRKPARLDPEDPRKTRKDEIDIWVDRELSESDSVDEDEVYPDDE